ncbi:glycosyltransferase family 4 protein [Ferrimicrobium sp.]|uniref:glycosyltransferase family 4 protein n=1 Tax=Ferrimicrobium sp. TaxID=2926050 RepID=UPI00263337BF|nr:glycosyltransferase family 4 protein [Ferrimicrobium sp.]
MHLVFVTPRYGQAIVGGAETAVRSYATRIASRGHRVEVITSTATTMEWENSLPAETVSEDGVIVHRLRVHRPRLENFSAVHAKVLATGRLPAGMTADQFLADQGPLLDGFEALLDRLDPDRVISYPLLYWPNLHALRWKPARSVLHPAAHPEPILASAIYADLVPLARRIVFQTHAEAELFNQLFLIGASRQLVLPLGLDQPVPDDHAGSTPDSAPYLLALGRLQADKGSRLLTELYRNTQPTLRLIMAGPLVEPVRLPPGVETPGIVSDAQRNALLRHARAVVIASRYESFSLVAIEAMGAGIALIVNGFNPVLVEQIECSGGGIAFHTASELLSAIELMATDATLATTLGQRGKAYAMAHFSWEQIIDRYLAFLQ